MDVLLEEFKRLEDEFRVFTLNIEVSPNNESVYLNIQKGADKHELIIANYETPEVTFYFLGFEEMEIYFSLGSVKEGVAYARQLLCDLVHYYEYKDSHRVRLVQYTLGNMKKMKLEGYQANDDFKRFCQPPLFKAVWHRSLIKQL